MAPSPSSPETTARPTEGLITLTHVIYALHAFSALTGLASSVLVLTAFLTGWPSIIAVILNYAYRADVRGTWLDSHFGWQIRTFWFALAWLLARGGVRDVCRDSGGAGGVDRDGVVGVVPHCARLDDAVGGEADAAAGGCLGKRPYAQALAVTGTVSNTQETGRFSPACLRLSPSVSPGVPVRQSAYRPMPARFSPPRPPWRHRSSGVDTGS